MAFAVLFKISNGQDTLRRYEFGSSILTVNSFNKNKYFASDRPNFEIANGLFFRYTKRRFGLRAQVSYSDYSSSEVFNYTFFLGPAGRDIHSKAVRFGIGAQFSILKHKDWFYTCFDISYRYLHSTGHTYGPWPNEFSTKSNGTDGFLGLGCKIKLIKNFILSPEVGVNSSFQSVNKVTTSTDVYLIGGGHPSYKSSYLDLNLIPVLQIHLTAKF